jgi:hypothetical protein
MTVSSANPSVSYSPTACTHERGPGTSVCLRCRAELHAKSAARLKRTLVRTGAVVVVIAIGLGIGGGAITMNRGTSTAEQSATTAQLPVEHMTTRSVPAPAAPVTSSAAAPAPAPPVATASTLAAAPKPAIEQGRTDFEDDIYAVRSGSVITVHFDTDLLRTRRRDKFETVVRETLPAVYGAHADSMLASIPEGQLGRDGDLLTELPTQGIHLPASGGWAITVWPETRAGRDGPLVVGYRAAMAQAN